MLWCCGCGTWLLKRGEAAGVREARLNEAYAKSTATPQLRPNGLVRNFKPIPLRLYSISLLSESVSACTSPSLLPVAPELRVAVPDLGAVPSQYHWHLPRTARAKILLHLNYYAGCERK